MTVSMDERFRETARRQPDHPAVVGPQASTAVTYAQLDHAIEAASGRLKELGVQPGECIALHLPSSAQYIIWNYAVWRCGGCVVPIPVELAANENDPAVLTYLGYSHRKLGNIDLAISLYNKALVIDPNNVDTREYLGEGYVSKGALDLAWLELVEIEQRCGTTCVEYQALEKAVRSGSSQY